MRRITELEVELAKNGDGNLEAEGQEDSAARVGAREEADFSPA
jgi:hypothetical protein